MTAEERLREQLVQLHLTMPPAAAPKGVYRPALLLGDLLYTAGHLPVRSDGSLVTGRLGADLDVEAGYAAAQLVALGLLATVQRELGSLNRVLQVVKVLGAVNSTAEFDQHPAVINGCSELLVAVFGPEAGRGVRTALGVASLPLGVPVEIEAIFQIGSGS
ncbi:MAG: RidA family protein [Thermoguttaceae bacterium]|jgi:enamine deaminase RidA (YjgF/YER057c/UK114 family)|nr:RidA family protein [Thermoguttaceae bacterium]